MSQVLEYVYDTLKSDLATQAQAIRKAARSSERSETAGGMASSTLAAAPLLVDGGMSNGDMLFISNGRKSGEGAGAGTGVPCYYNAATNQWLKFSDDTAVTV